MSSPEPSGDRYFSIFEHADDLIVSCRLDGTITDVNRATERTVGWSRDELVGRSKMARAQIRVQQALDNVSALDPTAELDRFEERVIREEATAQGMGEAGSLSFEEEIAQLEKREDEREVEARLARLKSGSAQSGQAHQASVG